MTSKKQKWLSVNSPFNVQYSVWYGSKFDHSDFQVQEVQTQTSRAGMESNFQREEVKRMRDHIQDLRGKLADMESKVNVLDLYINNSWKIKHLSFLFFYKKCSYFLLVLQSDWQFLQREKVFVLKKVAFCIWNLVYF